MNGLVIHDVTKVTVKTRRCQFPNEEVYCTQTIVIHARNRHDPEKVDKFEVTLFTSKGQEELPLVHVPESEIQ